MQNRIVGYMLEGDKPVPVYKADFAQCERFAVWLREPLNLEMERTSVRPGLLVATAFLGINRVPYPRKDLVLWETRVIRSGIPDPPIRYASAAAALTGHWETVYTLFEAECVPIPSHICAEIEVHVPAGFRLGSPQADLRYALPAAARA